MSSLAATLLVEALIVLAAAAAAIGLHALVQRRRDYANFSDHNDVAGFLLAVVGVMYAVVLGFVVVIVWQRYTTTRGYVHDEASAAAGVYRVAAAFPQPLRRTVREQLRGYIASVIGDEWPLMERGGTENASGILERVAYEIDTFRPADLGSADAHEAAISEMERLFDARRHRFEQVKPSVAPILWFALIAGAAATLAFSFLFGTKNRKAQLLMTGILAGVIAILFVVIAEFDTPFHGSVAIQPNVWDELAQSVSAIR